MMTDAMMDDKLIMITGCKYNLIFFFTLKNWKSFFNFGQIVVGGHINLTSSLSFSLYIFIFCTQVKERRVATTAIDDQSARDAI